MLRVACCVLCAVCCVLRAVCCALRCVPNLLSSLLLSYSYPFSMGFHLIQRLFPTGDRGRDLAIANIPVTSRILSLRLITRNQVTAIPGCIYMYNASCRFDDLHQTSAWFRDFVPGSTRASAPPSIRAAQDRAASSGLLCEERGGSVRTRRNEP